MPTHPTTEARFAGLADGDGRWLEALAKSERRDWTT
jgi:hypothetical protein